MPDLFSADALAYQPSAIRALSHIINDPRIISFAGGVPSPATFPGDVLAEIAQSLVAKKGAVSLQYGPTRGLPRLRETVAAICEARGIESSSDRVLITTGSQEALHLAATALVNPDDVILVELPSYTGGLAALRGRRAHLAGVEQDDDGIVPDSVDAVASKLRKEGRTVKALYTIPNFQNPSGRLMSQPRRDAVLELANKHGFVILEDDPYGELNYDQADTRPIASRGTENPVLYLGSFSKILAPGLRCGFAAGPDAILRRMELIKEAVDLCSGMLDQSIVDEFCARGLLPAQIEQVRDFYRQRRNVLIGALEKRFNAEAEWTEAGGGLFIFLTLKREVDTTEEIHRAVELGVAYVPGAAFFIDGSGHNAMRLTFAKEPDDRMREGVERLARLFS